MSSAVTALIDLDALVHNLRQVRAVAPGRYVMAVIKANAYGHDMLTIAKTLQTAGVDAFAVARFEEAQQLRQAAINIPLLCLEGFYDEAELISAANADVQAVVHHSHQVRLLEQVKLPSPITVWLKIDSGMHRMGIAPSLAGAMWQRLTQSTAVKEIKLMTHLASADDRNSQQTEWQLKRFAESIQSIRAEISMANSAGILGWPASHGDWVRPGIMLYGVSPFIGGRGEVDNLKPVMTLKSRVIAVNAFNKGDAIGYGGSWICPQDMNIAVVACGYGDGYPRHAAPGTPVLVNGQRLPLVGRVSMNSICLDLRRANKVIIGDEATLWGEGLPVEEVAEHATTIAYELLCSVAGRVKFETNK